MNNEILISQIRQRLEILYQMVDELEKSGGGGGEPSTTDYNLLQNLPKIEGVELKGNKTAAQLGLALATDIPTKTSDLSNDSNFVSDANYIHTDNNFTNEDKAQITTNENGIAALEQMNGKKNWINVNATSQTLSTLNFTVNADNTVVVNGSKPPSFVLLTINEEVQLPQGDYVLLDGTGASSSALNITLFRNESTWIGTTATNGKLEFTANGTDTYYCRIYVNTAVDDVMFKPMIITKEAYDAGFTDYTPYAPTNRELYEMILALQ